MSKKKQIRGIADTKFAAYQKRVKAKIVQERLSRTKKKREQEASVVSLQNQLARLHSLLASSTNGKDQTVDLIRACISNVDILSTYQEDITQQLEESRKEVTKLKDEKQYRIAVRRAIIAYKSKSGRKRKPSGRTFPAQGQTRKTGSHRNNH